MGRFRGIVLSAMLVIASIGVGVALAQAQADGGAPAGAAPPAGAPGPGAPAAGSPAAATAPWTSDVPRATALLSRLHHAAAREMLLGDLAEARATTPETRRYGAELSSEFRAYDQRVVGFAASVGIDGSRLAKLYAGENVAALRRESDDLTRIGNATGDAFDRGFWVAVAQEQSAASDMLPAIAAGGPELARLAADLSQVIDGASLRALYVARAQQPAGQSNQVKQVSPTR